MQEQRKSLFDCKEPDRSKWWDRLEVDNRFYKDGIPIIDNFIGEYRWLSNFHLTKIPEKSTEHYYQAAKAQDNIEGLKWRKLILGVETPNEAKKLGRKVPLRDDWDEIRDKVMKSLLFQKYLGSYDLFQKLINTGDAYLIEGNTWHDIYWGICIKKDCEKCNGKRGLNKLGLFTMELRQFINGINIPTFLNPLDTHEANEKKLNAILQFYIDDGSLILY